MIQTETIDARALRLSRERPPHTYNRYLMLVVLCSERDAQPVVNAGTLYQ